MMARLAEGDAVAVLSLRDDRFLLLRDSMRRWLASQSRRIVSRFYPINF
jgi:hypothetical protein